MKTRKSQITGDMLVKILILVFIVVIIIVGINGYRRIRTRQEEVSAVVTKSEI